MTLFQLATILLTYFGLIFLGLAAGAFLRLRQARRRTGDPNAFILLPYPRHLRLALVALPPIVLIVMWLAGVGRA